MACPFSESVVADGDVATTDNGVSYSDYLKVDVLRNLQKTLTTVHDEHLFIVVHQTYELWFRQIIVEIDSIRKMFMQKKVKESHMLVIVSRLNRVAKIMEILVEQIMILETMTPLDFMGFRDKLSPASGFQSLQFRIIENKLGVRKESRILYHKKDYSAVFQASAREECKKSEDEPSLFDLIQNWLERTPGLEDKASGFWVKFSLAVKTFLADKRSAVEEGKDEKMKELEYLQCEKLEELFRSILEEDKYNILRAKGDRRFSYKAIQGALQIYFYRDEVIFNQPFQLLNACMDIDSLLTKWRYNHVMLVQRQLGSRVGTGGSSGYQYLRSTVSDRYKVFLDLFNLSSYLLPREYIPPLKTRDRRRLTTFCMNGSMSSDSEEGTSNSD